ncbi:type II toxin-antitoxin system VapC family toxin [Geminocystis sp. CENA526]|uniref:type II toxin-antitoxin system VapC family toxin n=1 Tax=Geminocystis sp. CENA526 TaxID=1355871 RepID=UPI003D6F6BFD
MILLDTHIWIWWTEQSPRLTDNQQQLIENYRYQGLGVSIISCWEIAKLVENQKLAFNIPVQEWLNQALAYQNVELIPLNIPIIVQSTQLINFHKDPADQLIVATAKVYNYPLLTADQKILQYPDVQILT